MHFIGSISKGFFHFKFSRDNIFTNGLEFLYTWLFIIVFFISYFIFVLLWTFHNLTLHFICCYLVFGFSSIHNIWIFSFQKLFSIHFYNLSMSGIVIHSLLKILPALQTVLLLNVPGNLELNTFFICPFRYCLISHQWKSAYVCIIKIVFRLVSELNLMEIIDILHWNNCFRKLH